MQDQLEAHAPLIKNMAAATDEATLIIVDSFEGRLLFNSIVGTALIGLIEHAPDELKELLTRGLDVMREGCCLVLVERGRKRDLFTFNLERESLRVVKLKRSQSN